MTEQEIADMKSALEQAQESIKALEKTNKDLQAEKLDAKTKADKAEEAREELERQHNEASGDVEKIKADLKKLHDKELKKLQDANAAHEARLSQLLIDNTINEAIAKNGVLPHFAPAVTAMLKLEAKMENGEAVAGGVPLSDHIQNFFSGDSGKHFVAAPANTGGGAQGSTATASKVISSIDEYSKLVKENPAAAAAANLDPSLAYLKSALKS